MTQFINQCVWKGWTRTSSSPPQLFRIAKTTLIDILRKEETSRRMKTELAKTSMISNQTEEGLAESELAASLVNGIKQLPPIR